MKIGSFTFKNPFLLAPLAGITDKAMRSLCTQQGASLVYTEMASAKGLWYGDRSTTRLFELGADEDSTAFQLFGSEPEIMAFAAKELRGRKNVLLDLNVGCPVPKIVKNGEGSALLKNLDLLHEIVSTMVRESDKPVTAKFRMGFEKGENTAVETAKALEAAGAAAITIHGRTRSQYYEGKAERQVIADVKQAVKIPVIGNGDVYTAEDAMRMIAETGCDGVMIARGALGNPWIFREAVALWENREKPAPPTTEEKIAMLLRHLDLVTEDKGEYVAVREMRKHVGWYVKGMRGASYIKREINRITDVDKLRQAISGIAKETR